MKDILPLLPPDYSDEAHIKHYVWTGFYSAHEIEKYLEETGFVSEDFNKAEIKKLIKQEFIIKRQAESTFPEITDCDRLSQAFEKLNDTGIIALENAGTTQSDGLSDVSELYHQMGEAKGSVKGYCFYTGQDLENAVISGEFHIAFGAVDGSEPLGIEVGSCIKELLLDAGFDVEWEGSAGQRVCVKNIRWLKRGPV